MIPSLCVVTGSRAEYGLLRPLLYKLRDDPEISLCLVVTGSHLSNVFGNTQSEIEEDGFEISARVTIPLEGDSKADMARAIGFALSAFADYFEKSRPDLLLVLGDRYEIFAASAAAAILGIAVAHISGGDVTEGALDDMFRHCITKMSILHFPGCKQSAERIIQMGENPEYVFDVGELGVENCFSVTPMSISDLQKHLKFDLTNKLYSLVTFHPATMDSDSPEKQVSELILALERFPGMNFIITKANADAGGRAINRIWEKEAQTHPNWLVVSSLGVPCYLSAMKYAEIVIGNSSSGIVEAPAMKKPVVNIGDRQKGRMTAANVICCKPAADDIVGAMKQALSPEFRAIASSAVNPFGDGHTSQRIYDVIKRYFTGDAHDIHKKFYDLKVVS